MKFASAIPNTTDSIQKQNPMKTASLVGAFRRKTQTIVVTFFKTNEMTDFISFISCSL